MMRRWEEKEMKPLRTKDRWHLWSSHLTLCWSSAGALTRKGEKQDVSEKKKRENWWIERERNGRGDELQSRMTLSRSRKSCSVSVKPLESDVHENEIKEQGDEGRSILKGREREKRKQSNTWAFLTTYASAILSMFPSLTIMFSACESSSKRGCWLAMKSLYSVVVMNSDHWLDATELWGDRKWRGLQGAIRRNRVVVNESVGREIKPDIEASE